MESKKNIAANRRQIPFFGEDGQNDKKTRWCVRRRGPAKFTVSSNPPFAKLLSWANHTCRLLEFRITSIQVLEKRRLPIRTTITIINSTFVKKISMPCHSLLPGLIYILCSCHALTYTYFNRPGLVNSRATLARGSDTACLAWHRASGSTAQAVWLRSWQFFNHVFPGWRALHTQIFSSISRKKIWGKNFPQGGPTPKIFEQISNAP